MANNNENDFLTIPFDKVFNERIYVDQDADVIYDKAIHMAVGYLRFTHTCLEITFIIPDLQDDDFKDCSPYPGEYFNPVFVFEEDNKIYYRIAEKNILIGVKVKGINLTIKLPRLFFND